MGISASGNRNGNGPGSIGRVLSQVRRVSYRGGVSKGANPLETGGGTILAMAAMNAVTAMGGTSDVFPPDFSSTVGRIRALIPDVEQVDYSGEGEPEYMFSDAHLKNLHAISVGGELGRIYRAAASALRALAVSEGLIQKVIRTEDLQTDGAKMTSALLSAARALDDRADQADEDEESVMTIVDFQPRPQDAFPYTLRGFPAGWTASSGLGRWL